jgi:hypothetical protein
MQEQFEVDQFYGAKPFLYQIIASATAKIRIAACVLINNIHYF